MEKHYNLRISEWKWKIVGQYLILVNEILYKR